MAILKTLKVAHPDGFMLINESDFDSEIHTPFEDKPEADPVFRIAAVMDEEFVYWDGEDFVSEPSDKTYSSEDSAESAMNRTKAIQEAIADGFVTNVTVVKE